MRDSDQGDQLHQYEIQPVLCNRYDLPIVEFKMARRQGATREHVLSRRRAIFNSTLRAAVLWSNFGVARSASIAMDTGISLAS